MIARLLLERGASAEAVWKEGGTPLHQAARSGNVNVAQILLQNGAEKDAMTSRGETPLYVAAARGHVSVIRFLYKQGAAVDTPSKEDWSPLHAACYYRQPCAVEELLQYHADIAWRLRPGGWTLLHKAAARGFVDIAEILLRHGAPAQTRSQHRRTSRQWLDGHVPRRSWRP
jgi:ankyrin repeat protein